MRSSRSSFSSFKTRSNDVTFAASRVVAPEPGSVNWTPTINQSSGIEEATSGTNQPRKY